MTLKFGINILPNDYTTYDITYGAHNMKYKKIKNYDLYNLDLYQLFQNQKQYKKWVQYGHNATKLS